MIVASTDEHRAKHGVEADLPGVTEAGTQIAPSTYYAAKTRTPFARSVSDALTTTRIKRVHEDNYSVYGARKVDAELRGQGHHVARGMVQRLMGQAGLRGTSRVKGPRTTVPGGGPAPDRTWSSGTSARKRDRLWVADITYCRICRPSASS